MEYPTRFRYKMIDAIDVSVFNASSETIPVVQVRFDRSYIEQFSTVTFTPSVKEIAADAYVVELNDLQPGETGAVSVTIQAEIYGNHSGTVTATSENADDLQVPVGTFTFP